MLGGPRWCGGTRPTDRRGAGAQRLVGSRSGTPLSALVAQRNLHRQITGYTTVGACGAA